jgi:hypothetical protein
MIKAGLGYAWLPEHLTSEAIHQGALRALPLEMGSSRPVSLHLVLVRPETSGPAATGGRRSLSTPSSLSRLTGEPRRCPDLHRHHGHLCPDGRNNSLHRGEAATAHNEMGPRAIPADEAASRIATNHARRAATHLLTVVGVHAF